MLSAHRCGGASRAALGHQIAHGFPRFTHASGTLKKFELADDMRMVFSESFFTLVLRHPSFLTNLSRFGSSTIPHSVLKRSK